MGDEDERFSHIKNDPRFRPIPKKEKKVQIDKRFASMFHDKKFKVQYSMDKRGRPVQSSTAEDLKKYYEVNSSESENENEDKGKDSAKDDTEQIKNMKPVKNSTRRNGDSRKKKNNFDDSGPSGKDSHDEPEIDLARGEGNMESSSSDTSSEEDEEESVIDHKWGELEMGVSRAESISHRLAVCNMDWDRIKAQDLFVLFNNFKPAQGNITSVKIYPSEFGMQRMKEEELRGPPELTETTLASDEEDYTETKEGSKYHMEKLRKYQLNRLRYYYAVVECDSPETANALYTELDNMEYESSASQLDLRFIPDDVTFDQEPSSIANKLPDMSNYEPVLFTTKALQQTMVELTWDETNPTRLRTLQKAFNKDEQNQDDLRTYLASSSSSEAEEEDDTNTENHETDGKKSSGSVKSRIAKYKDLLASLENEEDKKQKKDIEMEITWEPGLKDKAESLLKMKAEKTEMTCFEEYLKKKKDKKQLRKEKKEKVSDKEESVKEDLCEDDDLPSDVDLKDSFFQDEINFKGQNSKNNLKQKKRQEVHENKAETSKDQGELELLLMENGGTKKHFNLKNLVEEASMSKRKKRKLHQMKKKGIKDKIAKEDDFKIDAEDARFSALFSSADFNIDPSDTHFKKTKAMETLLQEKHKRRKTEPKQEQAMQDTTKNMDPSLFSLIKSVKNKTNNNFKTQ